MTAYTGPSYTEGQLITIGWNLWDLRFGKPEWNNGEYIGYVGYRDAITGRKLIGPLDICFK